MHCFATNSNKAIPKEEDVMGKIGFFLQVRLDICAVVSSRQLEVSLTSEERSKLKVQVCTVFR